MMDTHTQAGFKLGTFSAAGSDTFAGLVRGDQVIALHALTRVAEAKGLQLSGSESVFALRQNWQTNFGVLCEARALADQTGTLDWAPVAGLKGRECGAVPS